MGKRHLFVILLLVAGALAEDVPKPAGEGDKPDETKASAPEDMDGVAAAPTPPESQLADDTSGLALTSEAEAKNEVWDKEVLSQPMAAPGSTAFVVEKIKYRWTIINYSHHGRRLGEALYSPQFWGPRSQDYKWQLQLYPKGSDAKVPLGVGLYLALSGKTGVTPTVKVSVINNLGVPVIPLSFKEKYLQEYAHGWNNYCPQSHFEYWRAIYVPNDRLTLEVEIIFSPSSTSVSGHCATPDKQCKKMPYQNNFNSDVHVYTNHESVKAHIAAFAAHSTWLKDQVSLYRPYTVEIPPHMGISIDDLREAVRFIYTGKIEPSNAKRMSEVAKTLGMDKLKEHAEEVLCLSGET